MLRNNLRGRLQKGDWRPRIGGSAVDVRPVEFFEESRAAACEDQHVGDLQKAVQIIIGVARSGLQASAKAQAVGAN